MKRKTRLLFELMLVIVLVFIGFPVKVSAQINRANLNGTVTDPSGARIPNATVAVVAPDTGFTRQTSTGRSGVYSISRLPTGTYVLTVSGKGFKTFTMTGIDLSVGQTRTVDAQFQVGAPTTKVQVRGTAVALDSNDAELGTVIQSQQLEDIPVNARDWAQLMLLSAGAVNFGGGGQRDLRFVGRLRGHHQPAERRRHWGWLVAAPSVHAAIGLLNPLQHRGISLGNLVYKTRLPQGTRQVDEPIRLDIRTAVNGQSGVRTAQNRLRKDGQSG
jgi:Carboxypeptidase regulatory-like domain